MSQEARREGRRIAPRIAALDGVRGAAILLVLIFHGMQSIVDHPVDAWAWRIAMGCWAGVDLFFVLSGYLITGILLDSRSDRHYFRNFYGRRFLRIFPAYYLFLAIFFGVFVHVWPRSAAVAAIAENQIWYWSYLQNVWYMLLRRFPEAPHLNHLWSLAIEEQFYLLWPWLVRACPQQWLGRVCSACVGGALAIRCITTFGLGIKPMIWFVATPARMDALAVGAWIAVVSRTSPGWIADRRAVRRIALVAGLAFLSTILVGRDLLVLRNKLLFTFGLSAVAIFFGALLVLLLSAGPGEPLHRLFAGRFLRVLGKFSYTIYLVHWPIKLMLGSAGISPRAFPRVLGSILVGQALFYLVLGSLSVAVAWASWHLWEKHFLELKARFT